MEKNEFLKFKKTKIIMLLICIVVICLIYNIKTSYSKPQEAILSVENDLMLIPAYKNNNEALFFFIKDNNNLGASLVYSGLFGWKPSMLTWSPMDQIINYEKLTGFQGYGENLIYGVIKNVDGKIIKVNEKEASILYMDMLPTDIVKKYKLDGLSIWYFKVDKGIEDAKVKLIDKSTTEVISSIE